MASETNHIRVRISESNDSRTIDIRIPNSYIFLYNLFNYFHQLLDIDYESSILHESIKSFENKNERIVTSLHEFDNNICFLNNECVICKEEFVLKEEVAMIDCKHIFHKKCINEWSSFKHECPLCRTNITTQNLDL